MDAAVYTQRESTIYGRKIWLYLISSPIGNIAVVDYEQPGKEIVRKLFGDSYDKAENYYCKVCRKILASKI